MLRFSGSPEENFDAITTDLLVANVASSIPKASSCLEYSSDGWPSG